MPPPVPGSAELSHSILTSLGFSFFLLGHLGSSWGAHVKRSSRQTQAKGDQGSIKVSDPLLNTPKSAQNRSELMSRLVAFPVSFWGSEDDNDDCDDQDNL